MHDAVGPESGTAPLQGPAVAASGGSPRAGEGGEGRGPSPVSGGGVLHHIELWVPDLTRAVASWGWLLPRLGAQPYQTWEHGRSWRWGADDGVYVVVEQSPALVGNRHERRSPGLNHLAFRAGPAADLDALVAEAPSHGWRLLFAERHPFAGGPDHRAAFLEDADGYEVELVADQP